MTLPGPATAEQQAIFDLLRTTKQSLIVEARAGAAKTTTLLEAIDQMPEASILMVAFNKAIAMTLEARLPPKRPRRHVEAKTLHAAGLSILNHSMRGRQIDKRIGEQLVSQHTPELPYPIRRAATRLLSNLKNTLTDREPRRPQVEGIALSLGSCAKLIPSDAGRAIDAAIKAYIASLSTVRNFDFDDMIWLPVVNNLTLPSRYQAILVDEAQDLNRPQLALIKQLQAPGGRTVIVGDPHQAIYGWRGAVCTEVWGAFQKLGAATLPLTHTFRCGRAIVTQANELVPEFHAAAGAHEGEVTGISTEALVGDIAKTPGTKFLLSRTNAELLAAGLKLWRAKVPLVFIGGGELLDPLLELIQEKLNTTSMPAFLKSLEVWSTRELARAEAAGAVAWIEQVQDSVGMLTIASQEVTHPQQIPPLLVDLFSGQDQPFDAVRLSTVHKAKGLEADTVYLLKETFGRHKKWPFDSPKPRVEPEEKNIEYVAITRAKRRLVWVGPRAVSVATRVDAIRDAVEEARVAVDGEFLIDDRTEQEIVKAFAGLGRVEEARKTAEQVRKAVAGVATGRDGEPWP